MIDHWRDHVSNAAISSRNSPIIQEAGRTWLHHDERCPIVSHVGTGTSSDHGSALKVAR
jgi:hypothetical protein